MNPKDVPHQPQALPLGSRPGAFHLRTAQEQIASMYPQGIFPTIVEKSGAYIKQYDVFSRLLEDRIIFIGTPIDDLVADHVVGQLLYLDRSGRNQDIKMYINSPGGSVTAGLAIYDTMQLIEPAIQTYCVGQAASMGAVLLAGGAAGKRFALPHSRIMIHQPWGGAQGTALDMEIQVKEILKMKAALEDILAKHTGRSAKEVNKACDRDNFMSSAEAKAFGLIDQIISKTEAPETPPK
jgi:ATP-dependent Clp protease protease subunit